MTYIRSALLGICGATAVLLTGLTPSGAAAATQANAQQSRPVAATYATEAQAVTGKAAPLQQSGQRPAGTAPSRMPVPTQQAVGGFSCKVGHAYRLCATLRFPAHTQMFIFLDDDSDAPVDICTAFRNLSDTGRIVLRCFSGITWLTSQVRYGGPANGAVLARVYCQAHDRNPPSTFTCKGEIRFR